MKVTLRKDDDYAGQFYIGGKASKIYISRYGKSQWVIGPEYSTGDLKNIAVFDRKEDAVKCAQYLILTGIAAAYGKDLESAIAA